MNWTEDDLLWDEMNDLLAESRAQLAENDHKTGWEGDEARWHFYKAHDELSDATYMSKHGHRKEAIRRRVADAFNHMLMGMDCVENDVEYRRNES